MCDNSFDLPRTTDSVSETENLIRLADEQFTPFHQEDKPQEMPQQPEIADTPASQTGIIGPTLL